MSHKDARALPSSIKASDRSLVPCSLAFVVLQLIAYVTTLPPSITGGDSGELLAVACQLGVAHPPGYPLFTLIYHTWMRLLPWQSPAWRANLLTAIFAAGAGLFVLLTVYKLTRSLGSALTGASLFSFARLTWIYATSAEVFGLNNLLMAVLCYLTCCFFEVAQKGTSQATMQQQFTTACYGTLVAGLATANQHTSVLYLVPCAVPVLWVGHRLWTPQRLVILALLGAIGPMTYLHLPLSALRNSAGATWGDQRDWNGFKTHVLHEEYGTFDLGSRSSTDTTFVQRLGLHAWHVSTESMFMILPLALIGTCTVSASGRRLSKVVLLAMLALYLIFFNARANLAIETPLLLGVHERFWLQPNIILSILAGCGMATMAALVEQQLPSFKASMVASSLAAVILALLLHTNYTARDESTNTAVSDFGVALLDGLAPGAVFFMKGDLIGNAARYHHFCEGRRSDVHLVDLELMTFEWYVPIMQKQLPAMVFPGSQPCYRHGPAHFDMKQLLDANYERFPAFHVFKGMNEADESYLSSYHIWHAGLTYRIHRHGDPLDLKRWFLDGSLALPNFPVPSEAKYDERTWEAVVSQEYLIAAVHFSMFFEDIAAASLTDPAVVRECWQASLRNYVRLFEREQAKNTTLPVYWDKNIGVAASNLEPLVENEQQRQRLVAIRHRHWRRYLASGAEDEQMEAIHQVMGAEGGLI